MNRRQTHDAEVFNEAWESRARGLPAAGETDVADLLACAEQFCRAAVVEPSEHFRTSLRVQLMTEAETILAPAPAGATKPSIPHPVHAPSFAVRRRLAGATAAFVGAAGFVGLIGTSAQALPGDMLYPVKRGVENVELAFHDDDISRGQFRLGQASERLAETRRLTDDGSSQRRDRVADMLDEFATQADDGSGSLFRAYDHSGSKQSITAVNDFSASAAADLAQLAGEVPLDADDSFQAAAAMVSDLVSRAARVCSSCGTADVTGLADVFSSMSDVPPASEPVREPPAAESREGASSEEGAAGPREPAPEPAITVPNLPLTQPPTSSSSPPKQAPRPTDVTDPVVGTLLGDEEQPGVVPGLLDSLLGGKK